MAPRERAEPTQLRPRVRSWEGSARSRGAVRPHLPYFFAALFRLAESEHVLLITLHHIIADGWSMGILVRELTALYLASVSESVASKSSALSEIARAEQKSADNADLLSAGRDAFHRRSTASHSSTPAW